MSIKINDGGPAFPCETWTRVDNGGNHHERHSGLSKRELFAAMAVSGMVQMATAVAIEAARNGLTHPKEILEPKKLAEGAVEIADALIAELEKGKS